MNVFSFFFLQNEAEFKINKEKCRFQQYFLENYYFTFCLAENKSKNGLNARKKPRTKCISINKREKVVTTSKKQSIRRYASLFQIRPVGNESQPEVTFRGDLYNKFPYPSATPTDKDSSSRDSSRGSKRKNGRGGKRKKERGGKKVDAAAKDRTKQPCTQLFNVNCKSKGVRTHKKGRRRSKKPITRTNLFSSVL